MFGRNKNKKLTAVEKKHRDKIKNYSKNAFNVKSDIARFIPTNYEKYAVEIANYLMNHKSAVVDFRKASDVDFQRLIDFLSGTTYTLGGTIDKLGDRIYLIAPSSVSVKDEKELSTMKDSLLSGDSPDNKMDALESSVNDDNPFN